MMTFIKLTHFFVNLVVVLPEMIAKLSNGGSLESNTAFPRVSTMCIHQKFPIILEIHVNHDQGKAVI